MCSHSPSRDLPAVWIGRPPSSSHTANRHFKGKTRGAERRLALESCWHHRVGLVLENSIHMFKEIFEPLGSSLPSTIQKILFGAESFLTKAPLALTLSLSFQDNVEPLTPDFWIVSHSVGSNSMSELPTHLSRQENVHKMASLSAKVPLPPTSPQPWRKNSGFLLQL